MVQCFFNPYVQVNESVLFISNVIFVLVSQFDEVDSRRDRSLLRKIYQATKNKNKLHIFVCVVNVGIKRMKTDGILTFVKKKKTVTVVYLCCSSTFFLIVRDRCKSYGRVKKNGSDKSNGNYYETSATTKIIIRPALSKVGVPIRDSTSCNPVRAPASTVARPVITIRSGLWPGTRVTLTGARGLSESTFATVQSRAAAVCYFEVTGVPFSAGLTVYK